MASPAGADHATRPKNRERMFRLSSLGLFSLLAAGAAVGVSAADVTVPGTYSSPYASTIALATGDTLSILSDGTATGSLTAVLGGTSGIVRIDNAGLIATNTAALSYGIQLQNGGITTGIVNSGTILAGRAAIGNNRGVTTDWNFTLDGGISNTGLLQVSGFSNLGNAAIQLEAGYTINGGITNGVGAIIESLGTGDQQAGIWIGSGSAATVFNGGIDNSGVIRAPNLNAIRITNNSGTGGMYFFGGVTNRVTGTISGPTGWGGLAVFGADFNGNIDNSGLIQGPNGIILRLSATCTGDLINRSGASIEGTIANSTAINFDSVVFNGAVTNSGVINGGTGATNTGFRVGSVATNKITGNVSNSGLIRGVTNSVSFLNPENAFAFTNTGTLSGPAAIGINTLNLQGSSSRIVGATTGSAAGIANISGTFTTEGTFNVGTLNVSSTARATMNHNVTVGAGGLNNAGRLIVSSGSSITVTATSGGQFLTSGTLLVNGTLAGAAISVQSSGLLGGVGTVNAATTIAGIHSPGNSAGVQTFGSNLTYQGGSSVLWELVANTTGGSGNFDQIVIPTGNLTFSGSTTLNLSFASAGSSVDWSNSFWSVDRAWLLQDLTSGVTTGIGNFSVATQDWIDSTATAISSARPGASFSVGLSGQDVVLNYVAVPEPATLTFAAAGVVSCLLVLRRRQKA